MSLIDIVNNVINSPAAQMAGLYIVNHIAVTAARANARQNELSKIGYYSEDMRYTKKLLNSSKHRIARLDTFAYSAIATLTEFCFFYIACNPHK